MMSLIDNTLLDLWEYLTKLNYESAAVTKVAQVSEREVSFN